MTRAVIYTRLSKDEPGATSLEDQERDCRDLAKRRELDVAAVYTERAGTSAYKDVARPEFDRMLADLESGTTIIAWELSRISRRGAEQAGPVLARIEEAGASLVTVTDGIDTGRDESELNYNVRAAIAKDESVKTSRRTRRGIASRTSRGLHHGPRAPYGLRKVDGRLEIDPETYPTAREIADRALRGDSPYAIVKALNSAGGSWAVSSVTKLLRTPGWAGFATHHKRDKSGKYSTDPDFYLDDSGQPIPVGEGVITLAEYRSIQQRIAARRSPGQPRAAARTSSLLSGIALCAQCGGPMVANGNTSKNYGCSRKMKRVTGCDGCYIAREPLDQLVADAFIHGLAALEPGDPLHLAVAEAWTRRTRPEDTARADQARKTLDATQTALERVDTDYSDGWLDRGRYEKQVKRLTDRRDKATRELQASEPTAADISPLLDPDVMREAWGASGIQARRDYLLIAIESVHIHRKQAPGPFEPGRVDIRWKGESDTGFPE